MAQLVSFSTATLPPAQRVDLWEDHNRQALIGLRCRVLDEKPFDGAELNLQLDRMHLARVRGSSHVVERPAEVIRKHPSDSIAVYLTLVGEAFFYHDDGVLTLHPGQALICDADRPFMRGFSGGLEELAIKIPRETFRSAPLSTPIVRDVAQARTLARLIDRSLRPAPPAGPAAVDAPHLRLPDESTILDLLAAMVGGRPVDPAAVHLANARVFIDDHLGDPALSAALVAAGIGISERHLSRAFAGTGFPHYVLGRRLDRARALLESSPRPAVAEAAARCGFGSAAYFSQAFRARFGVRAMDVRRS
jgi:AraC-like DNA-binding protein